MSHISQHVRHIVVLILLAILAIESGCSAGDSSHINPGDIASIAGTLPSLASMSPNENTTTDKNVLDQPEVDAGFQSGWKGRYDASFANPRAGISLMTITADVYKTRSRARGRFQGERGLLEQTFRGFADAHYSDIQLPESASDCSGISITHPLIVPQYIVDCIANTTVFSVHVIGTDEPNATDLASTVATQLQSALRSRISDESR